jgi:ABC-type multidrug transport system ATPase subunit
MRTSKLLEIIDLCTEQIGPISLDVSSSECVAIMGPSGSGKSLLLRAIVDLDPNNGSVRLNDQLRKKMPAHSWRKLVSLVPAETGWWADRVGDHFERQEELGALLEAVGMQDSLDWEVGRLSTGERHRLAIIRALQNRPRVLLLDEPTASLDTRMTAAVETLIKHQLAEGVCILLVTHDSSQAARLASRSFVMTDGQLAPTSKTAI